MGSKNGAADSGNANELADYILHRLPKKMFDPLPVNLNTENLKIKDGKICGLSSVRRYGDCTFYGGYKQTNVILNLEACRLSAKMKYKVKVGLVWIKGELSAVANQVAIRLDLSMEGDKINLKALEVLKLEDYKIVKFTGVSHVFNWMFKTIVNSILQFFKQKIIETLESEGKERIQKFLNKMSLSKYQKYLIFIVFLKSCTFPFYLLILGVIMAVISYFLYVFYESVTQVL